MSVIRVSLSKLVLAPEEVFPADLDYLGNAVQGEPDIEEDRGFDSADEWPEGQLSSNSGQVLAA